MNVRKRNRILIDADIPFIKGVLEPYCDVTYMKGNMIDNSLLLDKDAIIIRTRTVCSPALLSGSRVKAIFTATIGMDHIDLEYCGNNGIDVFSAQGCNAYGVMQYVVTAIFELFFKMKVTGFRKLKIGVVGAGNVGEKVASFFERSGFDVYRCDPPKSEVNQDIKYYPLDYLLSCCDVLTLHVPLDSQTRNMCSVDFLTRIKKGAILVNTSRGEVVDEHSLLEHKERIGGLVLDVWQNEPIINEGLASVCDFATPHIAGYSYEGKVNATLFSVRSLARFFGIKVLEKFEIELPELPKVKAEEFFGEDALEKSVNFLRGRFDIKKESNMLLENLDKFETLRSEYKYRRELPLDTANFLNRLLD